MNREQAKNILDAYVSMKKFISDESDDCSEALREVILDAMTEYKAPSFIYPNISYPVSTKPIITCTGESITYTGESTNGYACGS